MESFVKSLFERLDQASQAQLICIMDNAINEMHNNGIISRVTPEITAKLHDPDPNVRVTEKTSLAKSVGYSFVVSSKPGVTENGICHTVEINNNERFPNSIAICIQGGLEGLYQSGIYKKTKSGIMDYKVIIHKNGQDSSLLEQNLNVLNNLYDEFNIIINVDEVTQNNSSDNDIDNTPPYQNTTTRTDYFDEMRHHKQINQYKTSEGKNGNASKLSEWRLMGTLCLIFFLLLSFSMNPLFIIGDVAVILVWFLVHKKKRRSNNKDKFIKRKNKSDTSISSTDKDFGFTIVAQPNEYELDDVTFIREIRHIKCGAWEQYDVLLEARGYGWEDMKVWAEYMSKNDLDVSHGTLTVAGIIGAKEKEIIEQYHSVGNIQMIPALETEQGVISMGGTSQKLQAPVKIVWMNQTRCLRILTLVNDEILIRRYIETVIRRTFGTPDEMKLAKPIPKEQ